MTTPEALAEVIKDLVTQALCDQSLGSSAGTHGTRFTREEVRYIERAIPVVARAVLAHLGEREQRQKDRLCPWGVNHDLEDAQAAAHGEDVRKIQVRMMKLVQALEFIQGSACSDEDINSSWYILASRALAEADGR